MPYIWNDDEPDLSLRQKIINTLGTIAAKIVNFVADPIKDGIHSLHDWVVHQIEGDVRQYLGPSMAKVRDMPGMPEDVKQAINAVLTAPSSPGVFTIATVILMILSGIIGSIIMGPLRLLNMQIMRYLRTGRPSYRDAAEAYWKGYVGLETFRSNLSDMGMPDDIIEYLRMNSREIPNWSVLRDMYHRGVLSEDGVKDELHHLGHDTWMAAKIFAIFPAIPSISDLVRFGVREAFTPEIAEAFGQYQDFPAGMVPHGEKQGLSRDYQEMYWAAHWDLPSTTQGFDMFHRGLIDEPELKLLLRAQDVMPFWRDHLMGIAYRLPTRVDIRRMYRDGHLDRVQVKKQYRKRGYDEENAELLTRLAVTFYKSSEKDLTKTDIVNAYKVLGWSRGEAQAALIALGYDTREAEYYLDYADYKREQDRVEDATKLYRLQYTRGIIDQATVNRLLGELGKEAAEIGYLVGSWTVEREAKTERPTTTQLLDFYARRIIAGGQLAGELDKRGYSPTYASWYIESIEQKIAEENARKEAAELRLEMASHKYPTRADLASWYRAGIIDLATLRNRLGDLGYSAEDVAGYVEDMEAKIAGRPAFPTRSDLRRWLEQGILTRDQYISRMAELRYSRADIDRYLEEIEAVAEEARRRAEEAALREEMARVRVPTRSDLGRWFIAGILTRDEYIARMIELGYTRADVDLYLAELYAEMTEEQRSEEERLLREEMEAVRMPTRADLGRWFMVGIITEPEYRERMAGLGFSGADIARYLEELKAKMREE